MGGLKARTSGRILWLRYKPPLLKRDSTSRSYTVPWEESKIQTVGMVTWGCPHYLSLSNICFMSYTGPHFCGILCKNISHSCKQPVNYPLCNRRVSMLHTFTILYQPPVHDTNSRARFTPNIKKRVQSLNSKVSSGLSIITKSFQLQLLWGLW